MNKLLLVLSALIISALVGCIPGAPVAPPTTPVPPQGDGGQAGGTQPQDVPPGGSQAQGGPQGGGQPAPNPNPNPNPNPQLEPKLDAARNLTGTWAGTGAYSIVNIVDGTIMATINSNVKMWVNQVANDAAGWIELTPTKQDPQGAVQFKLTDGVNYTFQPSVMQLQLHGTASVTNLQMGDFSPGMAGETWDFSFTTDLLSGGVQNGGGFPNPGYWLRSDPKAFKLTRVSTTVDQPPTVPQVPKALRRQDQTWTAVMKGTWTSVTANAQFGFDYTANLVVGADDKIKGTMSGAVTVLRDPDKMYAGGAVKDVPVTGKLDLANKQFTIETATGGSFPPFQANKSGNVSMLPTLGAGGPIQAAAADKISGTCTFVSNSDQGQFTLTRQK